MFSGVENRMFSDSGQGARKTKWQIATEFTEGTATQEIIYKKRGQTRSNRTL